jgi:hypothetical protein
MYETLQNGQLSVSQLFKDEQAGQLIRGLKPHSFLLRAGVSWHL